ncbi:MAG: hypothetical protein ACOX5E_04010 [Bacilli bacterium]
MPTGTITISAVGYLGSTHEGINVRLYYALNEERIALSAVLLEDAQKL